MIGILFQPARVKAARSAATPMTTYQETYLYFYSLSCFIIEAVRRNHIKHVQIVNNVKVGSKLLTGSIEIPEQMLCDDHLGCFQSPWSFPTVVSVQTINFRASKIENLVAFLYFDWCDMTLTRTIKSANGKMFGKLKSLLRSMSQFSVYSANSIIIM